MENPNKSGAYLTIEHEAATPCPLAMCGGPVSTRLPQHLGLSLFFILVKGAVTPHRGFNLHFLIAHEAQYLFVSIVFINLFSSVKCLLVSPIFKLGCFVWCCGVLTVTFILYIHVFVRQVAGKQFLPDWSLFFHPFNRVFLRAKALILMKSSGSVFPFMDCGFGVKSKNFLPRLRSCRFPPVFF